MYTIAVVNQKGGVGKTTTAVTLAHGLAMRRQRVLLVDLDAQGNVADCLGMEKRGGVCELLGGDSSTSLRSARNDGGGSLGSARNDGVGRGVTRSGRARLDVVLGDKSTSVVQQELVGQAFRERALARALAGLEGRYEVCILDAAPSLDLLQVCALVAADGFLVPVKLDYLAVAGARGTLGSVETLRELGAEHARFLGVVPTFWDRTTRESDHQLRWLVEQFGAYVWPPVPKDCRVREAPAHGQTLWEYAVSTPALDGRMIDGERRGGYLQVLLRLVRVLVEGE